MITKSGLDSKNFEFNSAGEVSEELYMSYTSHVPTGLYVLTNDKGMEVCITNVGARIVSLLAADRSFNFRDVVLGFDSLKGYIDYEQRHSNAHGAVVGRFANRIANGKFEINGKTYKLPQNNGTNCLHGGPYGWAFQTFDVVEHTNNKLVLHLLSPDRDMGFPGNVDFYVQYELFNDNSLHIYYSATTDKATPINVTNHAYFNLGGVHNHTVLNDRLFINSVHMTPLNEDTCPTGEIVSIKKKSPFDFYGKCLFGPKYFKRGKVVGQDIKAKDEQIKLGNGYDHNFILQNINKTRKAKLQPYRKEVNYCAKLHNEESGITMEVFTTEPGVQLYDSVDLDGKLLGKKGIPISSYCGLCLETQHFPNSPNIKHFPSTILNPGDTFNSVTIYKFS